MKKVKKEQESKEPVKITDREMENTLVGLFYTEFWPVICKYNRKVDADTLTSLISIDPFKEPTSMARAQGMRMGLYSLENFVNEEVARRKEEEKRAVKGKSTDATTGDESEIPGYHF